MGVEDYPGAHLSAAAIATLDRLPCGWMAAADGRILALNASARRMVNHGWLDPASPALRALLRNAAKSGAAGDMPLPRATGRPLAVSVFPLQGALFCILISDPDEPPAIDAQRIGLYWGLTRSESVLATELLRGLDVTAAARRLGVTRVTARNHLRSILQKTGAHRQSELVRLLMTTPPRLFRDQAE
jgi:DNA-binding CsgD family transcriptional regulator